MSLSDDRVIHYYVRHSRWRVPCAGIQNWSLEASWCQVPKENTQRVFALDRLTFESAIIIKTDIHREYSPSVRGKNLLNVRNFTFMHIFFWKYTIYLMIYTRLVDIETDDVYETRVNFLQYFFLY